MAQFVTRLEDSLAERVDSLVEAGVLASRSEAVRLGLEALTDRLERERIGRQIVEGYQRMPETEEELAWADQSLEEMLSEEPWTHRPRRSSRRAGLSRNRTSLSPPGASSCTDILGTTGLFQPASGALPAGGLKLI